MGRGGSSSTTAPSNAPSISVRRARTQTRVLLGSSSSSTFTHDSIQQNENVQLHGRAGSVAFGQNNVVGAGQIVRRRDTMLFRPTTIAPTDQRGAAVLYRITYTPEGRGAHSLDYTITPSDARGNRAGPDHRSVTFRSALDWAWRDRNRSR